MTRTRMTRTSVAAVAAIGGLLTFGAAQAQFVCPVLGGQAGEHGNHEFVQLPTGDYCPESEIRN